MMTRGQKRDLAIVVGLTLVALALRLWGIRFGLPFAESRPDEMLIISSAMGYGTGDLNPHFFNYPSLMSYLVFAAYGVYVAFLKLTGSISDVGQVLLKFAEDPTVFFLIPRCLSALLGALTVGALFVLARRTFGARAAAVAALLLAVSSLHVLHSHFGVTDVAMTAFTVFAMIPIAGIFQEGRRRHYVLAGVLAGLATSMKYNAAVLAISILAAHWLSRGMGGFRRRLFAADLRLSAACMLGAFALTSPFVFLDWPTFLHDLRTDVWLLSGEGEAKQVHAWWYHLKVNLWHGVGPIALLAAGVGVVLGLRREWRLACVLLVFPVVSYAIAGRGFAVFSRYAVLFTPFVCLFAGVALGRVSAVPSAGRRRDGLAVLSGLVLIVAAGSQLKRAYVLDRLLARPDTRQLAVEFAQQNIPAGSTLGWVGTRYGYPHFPEAAESIRERMEQARAMGSPGRLLEAQASAAKRRGGGFRVQAFSPEALAGNKALPEYIWVEWYPLAYSLRAVAGAEANLTRRGYEKVVELSGASRETLTGPGLVYDFQDSFYVPYVGFEYLRHPGPTLSFWQMSGGTSGEPRP